MGERPRTVIPVLQTIALIAPSLYTGLTFTYSHAVLPPMIAHAPPKLLAKQWLQAYQFAPFFVAPLVLLGASSNGLLAYLSAGLPSHASTLYSTAAVAIFSIIPYTALYMEPGINGAGKWKAQELLRGEFELKGRGQGTDKDTARASWKKWTADVDMKTIAELWVKTNTWRYVVTGIATVISAAATIPVQNLCFMHSSIWHYHLFSLNYNPAPKMPNPPWQRLSRDQLVTIIADYYKVLTRLYIPESALKFPPPGGWPNITQETTKGFPRAPIVIDLLKYLPYIGEEDAGEMITNIHYKSDVVDYSTWGPHQWANDDQFGAMSVEELVETYQERRLENSEDDDWDEAYLWYRDEDRDKDADGDENWWDGDEPDDIKLENMIVLANGYESGGRAIILDVFKGNIYEDIIRCSGLQSEEPVECYFDNLKTKFEKLVMVPVPGYELLEGDLYEDPSDMKEVDDVDCDKSLIDSEETTAQQLRNIYRSFGWPGDDYNKEGAVAAVRAHFRIIRDA
ncbi:hypothetical protein OPT61_g4855 [Boeremia exigua]|uniref:Uncharacterized protein n=1 Tax=Boeremia exigua TaxID=749465 RepID=A0ACC2ICQ6_9PLEO|nr:hypothetical protein OPT61_g4855 [Boeremia exigua]